MDEQEKSLQEELRLYAASAEGAFEPEQMITSVAQIMAIASAAYAMQSDELHSEALKTLRLYFAGAVDEITLLRTRLGM